MATENRIRAGADAATGYPRFGILTSEAAQRIARRTVQIGRQKSWDMDRTARMSNTAYKPPQE
jgi:hypothetical protein